MPPEIESVRWARLEPRSRDKSLAPGLEARVHDPLWLLGRQWQFGELNADGDLGSAIVAEISAQVVPVARYRPGRANAAAAASAYDPGAQPLETLVEAEEVQPADSVRARARAGQHFERLLTAHGAGAYAGAFRAAFALTAEPSSFDASSRRFAGFLAGRAIDGARLHAALVASLRPADGRPPALPATPAVNDADVERVRAAATAWLAWSDSLVRAPRAANAAWIRERMEYAFAIDAPAADGAGMLLEAEEYTDGTLDWHTFSAAASTSSAAGNAVEAIGPRVVIPSTVTYPGMPASRLWEFEDARVDFGGVEANPEDLGRMLLTEFALVYGGDWLLVPLEAPAGSLVRIVALDVRDTFGRVVRVGPTTSIEPPSAGWRMFGISPGVAFDAAAAGINAPQDVLFVAPALAVEPSGTRDRRGPAAARRDGQHGLGGRTLRRGRARPADGSRRRRVRTPPRSGAAVGRGRHAHVSASYRRPAALVTAAAAAAGAERSVDDAAPGCAAVDSARRQPRSHTAAGPVACSGAARTRRPARRGSAAGRRARDARLSARAVVRRHDIPLARAAEVGRPGRGIERSPLRRRRPAVAGSRGLYGCAQMIAAASVATAMPTVVVRTSAPRTSSGSARGGSEGSPTHMSVTCAPCIQIGPTSRRSIAPAVAASLQPEFGPGRSACCCESDAQRLASGIAGQQRGEPAAMTATSAAPAGSSSHRPAARRTSRTAGSAASCSRPSSPSC